MTTPTNHWKLGLFVVTGIVVGLGSIVALGARGLRRETTPYETFMDESVQGLEVGSPVKFRGVTLGAVSRIAIAPDKRHVRLTSDLDVDDMIIMGLASGDPEHLQVHVPPDVRIQLASAGITGVKFLQLDYFNVKTNPRPELPFKAPDNYIPAAVSTMKNLEDAVVRAVDRFPEMTDALLQVLAKLDTLLASVEAEKLPERTARTLRQADDTLQGIKKTFTDVRADKLSSHAQQTLERLDSAVARLDSIIARVGGDKGMIVAAERAADALGDVASNASGATDELGTTLRDVQQAAQAIQKLTDTLERDSDMLIKGRAGAR
jgi:phospholipid/cholesterol/gamma-HCH transport system substrate-binding protein